MRKTYFITGATVIFLIMVALWVLYRVGPERGWFPPCFFHSVTHLYCPGCGSTRAVYRLLHGDLKGCFSANVLLFPSALLTLWVARRMDTPLSGREYFSIIVLYLFYGIARNLPFEPFVFLMPR